MASHRVTFVFNSGYKEIVKKYLSKDNKIVYKRYIYDKDTIVKVHCEDLTSIISVMNKSFTEIASITIFKDYVKLRNKYFTYSFCYYYNRATARNEEASLKHLEGTVKSAIYLLQSL
jgi:hypothetical protein